jgi:anti-sigma B factor antagonist
VPGKLETGYSVTAEERLGATLGTVTMGRPAQLEIERKVESGNARLMVEGELDIATVPRLERAAEATLDQHLSELVIDLSGLTFMDSTGLRFFIELYDDASEHGWTLTLLHPAGDPLRVFQLSGTEDHLPLVTDPC